MIVIAQLLVALVPVVSPLQDSKPSADGLVEQAWQLLPAYDGEHRYFLTDGVRRETAAGTHLLRAALELDDVHLRALWSLGHAHILLGEDCRNRGRDQKAWSHYEGATEALTRALSLDPTDPWTAYARGTAHTNFGAHDQALADLTRATTNAEVLIRGSGDASRVAWLRFKALEWRCEVLMRAREHDRARNELRAFHVEFSENEWPLFIALAENHLRERDFAGARTDYDQALALFPDDSQAYAMLGYLEGLVGDRETATQRLTRALELERVPDLYTRLWSWILATDERAPDADEELRGFLENPPGSLTEWDLRLGRFLVGSEPVENFLAAGRGERDRRMAEGQKLDDLMCEAWFYAGLRLELDSQRATEESVVQELRREAFEAHRTALTYTPVKWKWEWAYARLHFARLASTIGVRSDSELTFDGLRITHGPTSGVLEEAHWHTPESERWSPALERDPRPGDLLFGKLRAETGTPSPLQLVVGVR